MAAFVITNPVIVVNGVDLSDHVTSVSLDDSVADIDTTNFGTSGNHTRTGGLKDGSITIEAQNDMAASSVDATIWGARGTLVTVTVKATFTESIALYGTPTLTLTQDGDATVPSISAASILAKVHRDRLCLALHEAHPAYGFATHKGYPTADHLAALREHGACDAHRRSYAPVRAVLDRR